MDATTMKYKTRYNPETKTWSGPLDPPDLSKLKFISCGEKILNGLSENPDKIGQICFDNGICLTRNELKLQSIRVAQHLHGFGYRKDDIIMIISRNNHKVAPIIYGSLMAGLQVAPVGVGFEIVEIDHMIKLTNPKLIVLEYDVLRTVENILRKNNFSVDLFIFDKSVFNYKHVDCLLQKTGRENNFRLVDIDDPVTSVAFIVFSSGTTGPIKGIRFSHAHFSNLHYDLKDATLYTSTSVYWIYSVYAFLVVAFTQTSHVVTTQKFSPELISQLLKMHSLTVLYVRPDYISMLIGSSLLNTINFSTVKCIITGGTNLKWEDKIHLEKYLPNGRVADGYSFIEFGDLVATTVTYRNESVSFLANRVQVRIYNDDNELCGPNEIGELHVRPNLPFLGYVNNEIATRNILDTDGWIKSGDLFGFDDDGNLYMVGRKEDVIIYMDQIIYPNEIEDILKQHKQIDDVAIIGLGEYSSESLLCACIMKKSGAILNENDIHKFLDGKIEDYQKLRGGIFFMNEFPKTASGKIKKRKLKEKITRKLFESKCIK